MRREFLGTLAGWLLDLPQRDEHRSRLLPYLLAALADPAPDLAAAAAAHVIALGAQYEREHVAELKACCLLADLQQPPRACLNSCTWLLRSWLSAAFFHVTKPPLAALLCHCHCTKRAGGASMKRAGVQACIMQGLYCWELDHMCHSSAKPT